MLFHIIRPVAPLRQGVARFGAAGGTHSDIYRQFVEIQSLP